MRNKTKEQLKTIILMNSYAKRDFTSPRYKYYWDAWNALNEMYNRGDA
jgi:hypothetical protein